MRLRLRQLGAVALVGAIFTLHVTGCTVLGFGAGAIVDSARPNRYDPHSPESVTEVSWHRSVVLVLLDSTQIRGRYAGVEPDETADSAASPESATKPLGKRIAILGSGGTITQVAIDSIAYLAVAAPKHGMLVGGLLGLCVDVWIAVYFAYFAQWD
jgi:hypothetical protein